MDAASAIIDTEPTTILGATARLQASNHAFIDRPGCCDAQRMAIQTSFAKEVTCSQDGNYNPDRRELV
jgi:hypothetical protein